jgi:ssRNA-specific RNase YbeY (16S rRNA maturation enzyme)
VAAIEDTEGVELSGGRTLAKVPDNAVSISERSEAPDGASVITGPRGGLHYIPAGDDDSDAGGDSKARQRVQDIAESGAPEDEKKAELESVVSDTTGVESVNFDNFDEQQATDTSDALVALGDAGETDGIQEITTDVSDEMAERDSVANYDPFDQTIRFDSESFTQEKAQEWSDQGYLAGDSIQHLVAHEVGHARHFQKEVEGQSAGMQAQAQEIPEAAREPFAEQVSVYAVENANEMVAELYAMQVQGEDMTVGMENAYDQFNGPEVNI